MNWQQSMIESAYVKEAAAGTMILLALIVGYFYGRATGKRRMNALVKKRDGNHSQTDMIMKPTPDGAMEIQLSKKAYKNLRHGPLETMIVGQKDGMVFRIVLA